MQRRLRIGIGLVRLNTEEPHSLPLRLTERVVRHAPHVEFVLFATGTTLRALSALTAENVTCYSVAGSGLIDAVLARLDARLPGQSRRTRLVRKLSRRAQLQRRLPATDPLRLDGMFCPYTVPSVRRPGVSVVGAVDDLRHVSHPHLLTSAQRARRAREVDETFWRSRSILLASRSLLAAARDCEELRIEETSVIPPARLLVDDALDTEAEPPMSSYYLVPCDFEPRHNHELLLTAFALLRARRPASSVGLVLAGAPNSRMAELQAAAERMGLADAVRFDTATERAHLIRGSRAIIVPSLYETIGQSMLEAMRYGRPVLCSRLADLTDLTGDAALTFDPHRPADVLLVLERIEDEPALLERTARAGRERFDALPEPASVAEAFMQTLAGATQCSV